MPKIILNCRPNGWKGLGRPLKRLLDESETGLLRHNWWQMIMMSYCHNILNTEVLWCRVRCDVTSELCIRRDA
jgi:hypothetical protein